MCHAVREGFAAEGAAYQRRPTSMHEMVEGKLKG